jgi:hypothetical protein
MLKQLQSSLAAGKQAGILSQLDQEELRQLLLLLLELVRMGQDQLLDEQDMVSFTRPAFLTVLGPGQAYSRLKRLHANLSMILRTVLSL